MRLRTNKIMLFVNPFEIEVFMINSHNPHSDDKACIQGFLAITRKSSILANKRHVKASDICSNI